MVEFNLMQQNAISTSMKSPDRRRGRPQLPPHQRRIQVHTTVTPETLKEIADRGWQINELIECGMLHKDTCGPAIIALQERFTGMETAYNKIEARLQEVYEELESERLKNGKTRRRRRDGKDTTSTRDTASGESTRSAPEQSSNDSADQR